jgi:stage V sporulation protein K
MRKEGARMDRKDEIIQLQNKIIEGLSRRTLADVRRDLFETPVVPATAGSQKTAEKPAAQIQPAAPEETIEDLKKELQGYTGLTSVKREVDSLINWITVSRMRKEHGLPENELALHMVFTGNPGTGKTMIARLMARVFKCLKILSKGTLLEVDRGGLVAGYVGQTAIKTKEAIDKAIGGVLFVDEAYALTSKGANDFGAEAVDTLLKAMEDNRDDLVVIVAGYTELMEEFVHSNPGLESRFNRFIHFPDYTLDEMADIFLGRCAKAGYALDNDANDELRDTLERESKDVDGFGNARGVRNLFELAAAAQANRLAAAKDPTREMLMALTPQDILDAAARMARPENPAAQPGSQLAAALAALRDLGAGDAKEPDKA